MFVHPFAPVHFFALPQHETILSLVIGDKENDIGSA